MGIILLKYNFDVKTIYTFYKKKTNKNNDAGTILGYNAGINFYSRMVNISGISEWLTILVFQNG